MFQCVNSFECKTKCQTKNGEQYYDDDEIEEYGCDTWYDIVCNTGTFKTINVFQQMQKWRQSLFK